MVVLTERIFQNLNHLHNQHYILEHQSGIYLPCLNFQTQSHISLQPRYLDLVTGFAVVIPSILANRIMLNVRIVYYGSLMLSGVTPSDFTLRFPEYDSSGYEGVELVLRRHK